MRRERAAAYALGAAIYTACTLIVACWADILIRVLAA